MTPDLPARLESWAAKFTEDSSNALVIKGLADDLLDAAKVCRMAIEMTGYAHMINRELAALSGESVDN